MKNIFFLLLALIFVSPAHSFYSAESVHKHTENVLKRRHLSSYRALLSEAKDSIEVASDDGRFSTKLWFLREYPADVLPLVKEALEQDDYIVEIYWANKESAVDTYMEVSW